MMSSDERTAASIDMYWTRVAHNPAAPPPDDLDAGTAELVRRLAVQLPPPDPDERFVADLRARLLAQAARQKQAAQRSGRPSSRGRSLVVQTSAALVLVAVAWLIWGTIRPPAVQAGAVLRRVQEVSADPVTSGIRTMVFTEITTYGDQASGSTTATVGAPVLGTERQGVFAAPFSWRVEERSLAQFPDGRTEVRSELVQVSDGMTQWNYDVTANTVRVIPSSWAGLTGLMAAGVDATNDPRLLIGQQLPCIRAEVQAREQVAGRNAYLIVFEPACASEPGVQPELGERRVWIDVERFIALKDVWLNRDGSLWRASEITSIAFNTPIAQEQFSFTPPPGALVVQPAVPAMSEELFLHQVAELATKAPFPVFAPRSLPSGYIPREPALVEQLILVFALPDKAIGERVPANSTVTIYQRAATDADTRRQWPVRVEGLSIDGFAAHYDPGEVGGDGRLLNRGLTLVRDSVVITIQSDLLSRDELVVFARTLEPVEVVTPSDPAPERTR